MTTAADRHALQDLLARMATDPALADEILGDPTAAGARHGLTEDEVTSLRGVRLGGVDHRPTRLEERLSRSALVFGGELHTGDPGGDSGGDSGGGHDSGDDSGHASSESSADDSSSSDSSSSDSDSSSSDSESDSSDSDSSDSPSSDSSGSSDDDAAHTGDEPARSEHSADTTESRSGHADPTSSGSEDTTSAPDPESTTSSSADPATTGATPPVAEAGPAATPDPDPDPAHSPDAGTPGTPPDSTAASSADSSTTPTTDTPPGQTAEPDTTATPATHDADATDVPAARLLTSAHTTTSSFGPVATAPLDANQPATPQNAAFAPRTSPAAEASGLHLPVLPDSGDHPGHHSGGAGDPNSSYHGGIVSRAADGPYGTRITFADGGTVHTSTWQDPTTGRHTETWTSYESQGDIPQRDGGDLVRTWYDGQPDRGGLSWMTHNPAHPGGVEYLIHEGGYRGRDYVEATWQYGQTDGGYTEGTGSWTRFYDGDQVGPEDPVFQVVEHDHAGTTTATTLVHRTDAGDYVATVTNPDGTTHDLAVTRTDVTNADGTTTLEFGFPDGDAEAFTLGTDGRVVFHQATYHDMATASDAPAPTTTTTGSHWTVHEGFDRDVYGGEFASQDLPGGGHSETLMTPTGVGQRLVVGADGTVLQKWDIDREPDGTITESRWPATANTPPDVVTHRADGVRLDDVWVREPGQPVGHVQAVVQPDGSSRTVYQLDDGRSATAHRDPDGHLLVWNEWTPAPGGGFDVHIENYTTGETLDDYVPPNTGAGWSAGEPQGPALPGQPAHDPATAFWPAAGRPLPYDVDPDGAPDVDADFRAAHGFIPPDPETHYSVSHDADGNEVTTVELAGITQVRTIHPDGTGTRVDWDPDPYEERGGPSVMATWTIERQPDGYWYEQATTSSGPGVPLTEILYAPDGATRMHAYEPNRLPGSWVQSTSGTFPDGYSFLWAGHGGGWEHIPHDDGGWTERTLDVEGHDHATGYSPNGTVLWTSSTGPSDVSYYDPNGHIIGGTWSHGQGRWGNVPPSTETPPEHSFDAFDAMRGAEHEDPGADMLGRPFPSFHTLHLSDPDVMDGARPDVDAATGNMRGSEATTSPAPPTADPDLMAALMQQMQQDLRHQKRVESDSTASSSTADGAHRLDQQVQAVQEAVQEGGRRNEAAVNAATRELLGGLVGSLAQTAGGTGSGTTGGLSQVFASGQFQQMLDQYAQQHDVSHLSTDIAVALRQQMQHALPGHDTAEAATDASGAAAMQDAIQQVLEQQRSAATGASTPAPDSVPHGSAPEAAASTTEVTHDSPAGRTAMDAGIATVPAVTTPPAVAPLPAVDPNASYHGGVVRTAPVTNADGTQTVHVRYGDGTAVEVARTTGDTGVSTDTWTEPDGTTVVRTWSTDGSGTDLTVRTAPDGTTTAESVDATFSSEVIRPDRTWTQTSWGPTSAAPTALFTIVDHPGGTARVETAVTPTASGGCLATITSSDGSVETVRVAVREVDNPDGSTTQIVTFPDGDTDAFTTDDAGRVVHHESHHADASAQNWATPSTPTRPPPDIATDPVSGDVTTVETDPDGHRITTTTSVDGTETRTDTAPDGSWSKTTDGGRGGTSESYGTGDLTTQISTKNADGSWRSANMNESGLTWEMTGTVDGTTTETQYEADGSWYRNVGRPDGTRVETVGDPGGATDGTYTEYDVDGSGTTYGGDGSTYVMRSTPEGGTEHIETAPDGTVTTTLFGTDNFATQATVVHPDGTGTRTYYQPDDTMRTVPVTRGTDGTITEVPPAPRPPSDPTPTEGPAPTAPAPDASEELAPQQVDFQGGSLDIFRYRDGHIEVFAGFEDQTTWEGSFATEAEMHSTVIKVGQPVDVSDGVGTYHYKQQVWYADGRFEWKNIGGGVHPIWDDWF